MTDLSDRYAVLSFQRCTFVRFATVPTEVKMDIVKG